MKFFPTDQARWHHGRYLSIDKYFEKAIVFAGDLNSFGKRDLYQEDMKTGQVIRKDMSFRDTCEFKVARARGDFKTIGVT